MFVAPEAAAWAARSRLCALCSAKLAAWTRACCICCCAEGWNASACATEGGAETATGAPRPPPFAAYMELVGGVAVLFVIAAKP